MIYPATREEMLAAVLQSTATLLRGMMADPTLPAHAREALRQRAVEIEAALAGAGVSE